MPEGNFPPNKPRFGSQFAGTADYDTQRLKKSKAYSVLDEIGEALEPSATQQQRAEVSYLAVGAWLAEDPRLKETQIYAQGSAAHGTMNKPIGRNEHDVDLICHIPTLTEATAPAILKAMVGERLRENSRYRDILEEMPRCWRLNYAGDFHLDITPSILNAACINGGELVPDKRLRAYKASNPKGYRDLFARRASLQPMQRVSRDGIVAKSDVEPFPTHGAKGILRRTVQLLKRHRDIAFVATNAPETAPLSIIITTLASQGYEWCVTHHHYDNELDLLCDTVRAMPWFIRHDVQDGSRTHLILNETTDGENFAEKWNAEPARAAAFTQWHERALRDFERLAATAGLDQLGAELEAALGKEPVAKAMNNTVQAIGTARTAGRLGVSVGAGLSLRSTASTAVRPNTFFGR